MALVLKADTLVKVVIGPVVAVGDGFTPVTTLAVSSADEAEIIKHDAAAVTDISGNTFAAITSADGYYNLTLTAAQLDTEGMLVVIINDDSLCLPLKALFMVVNANVYDSLYAVAATDHLQVDTIQISGDATAADNCELDYDGTGYAKANSTIGTCTTLTGHTAQTGDSFARIGAAGASLTDLGGMSTAMKAEVQVEADASLVSIGLDHLLSAAVIGTDVVDNSVIAKLVSASATADWDDFANTTDSLQAVGDKVALEATVAALNDISTAQVNTEVDTALTDIGLDHLVSAAVVGADVTDDSIIAKLVSASATADWDDFVNTTESLQAIRDRGDTAWTSAESSILMQNTTIATLASQTSFTLTAGSADDSAYLGCVVVVTDASTAVQKCVGIVSAYTGSTKTVTLLVDPAVFTMAIGDTIDILADRSLKASVPTRTLAITAAGRPGVDWANVENPSSTVGLSATTVGTVTTCATVTTLTGHTAQTGDSFARIGAPVGADISADIAAVKVDTAATLVDTSVIGVAGAGLTDLGGMSTAMKAEVKTEAVAALNTDTYAESSAVPAATATLVAKIAWLATLARNKVTQTATTLTVRNDADTADVGASTVSDDGTTATRGEFS